MMKENFSFTDLERLELVAQRLFESRVDLTANYSDWVSVTFACASLGELARESYHTICSLYPDYKREVCDEKFNNCLKCGNGSVTIATLIKMAQDAGIDTTMPRGRRKKTEKQQQEEKQNRIQQVKEELKAHTEWRFNVWRNRPELREEGHRWRPIDDRDLDTYYCRLKDKGINVKHSDVKAVIFSRDFSQDYDAIKTWLNSLKPWNPDTDPDYLHEFYIEHLEFGDPENEAFYGQMFKKWHVALVKLMLGEGTENPLMVIFKGAQHIGKTFFARNILPPELSDYRLDVAPSARIDKDFEISLSETPLILFDEISFGSNLKNEAFKYIVTSNRSNVRDAYAHFREVRERRASLIATTNEDYFIRESEGSRRYLVVDLVGTVDLDNFPLPYEGAYAQAIYMLEHDFESKQTHDESQMITEHNKKYMETDDCEEAILIFLKIPDGYGVSTTMSAGDIQHELSYLGFHGREYSTVAIGKAMKRLGFEKKTINGKRKYLVEKINTEERKQINSSDTKEFMPEIF